MLALAATYVGGGSVGRGGRIEDLGAGAEGEDPFEGIRGEEALGGGRCIANP